MPPQASMLLGHALMRHLWFRPRLIDYILDERMCELGVEEKRMLTLTRLGLDL